MKHLITSALIALASPAVACDTITLHVASYHTAVDHLNEKNPGLGCRLGDYEVGGYKNSYSDFTAYAVRDFTMDNGLGVFAGIMSGYQGDPGVADHGVTPMAGLVWRGDLATLRAAPTVGATGDVNGAVIGISLNVKGW